MMLLWPGTCLANAGPTELAASLQVRLASAYEDYRHQRYESARGHLQGLVHPKVAHLLGMISRKQGRLVEAQRHLEWAVKKSTPDAEITLSLGQLYRELKEGVRAQDCYRQVLKISKDQAIQNKARTALAELLIERSQAEEALSLVGEMAPGSAATLHLRGKACLELGELGEARNALSDAFAMDPSDKILQSYAQVLWLDNDIQAFDNLVANASKQPGLGAAAVGIARSSCRFDWAWEIGLGVAAEKENAASFRTVMATLAVDRQDADSAIALAGDVVRANPLFGPAVAPLIAGQLMQGSTDKAEILIQRMREAEPLGQHWIGYELVAARQLGREVSAMTSELVGVYELPVPEGFASLPAFNQAFADKLSQLHQSKQQPLGQSLRGGTQTGRNLATLDDALVQSYMKALRIPVAQHLEKIGTAASNPCSARNTGEFVIDDCWSVTLGGSGFHESHVHPEGWLSSAYYVSVPESTGVVSTTEDPDRSGWLKFGVPPLALPVQQEVLKWVEPQPGLLALFPSYLWHSTEPVADGGLRVTAPFDVLPL